MVMRLKDIRVERNQRAILQNISGEFQRGKIYALLGPNGAGKSTLMQVMAQLLGSQGELEMAGQDARPLTPEKLAQQLAYLPQHSQLQFPLSVEEVLALATMPFELRRLEQRQQVKKAVALWGIEHLVAKDFRQLSGGEQQRCQLARTFIQLSNCADGGIWLLDEPTSSLDLEHQQQLQQICKQAAAAGHCIVLVLHDLNLAMGLADEVWVLEQGQLVAQGESQQVLTAELVKQVFKVNARTLEDGSGGRVFIYDQN